MMNAPAAETAQITEIFSSIQGEGLFMGERHLFLRFHGCQLHCSYCDEYDKNATEISRAEILKTVEGLETAQGPHAMICLTGGEPLLASNFLKPLMRHLKTENWKTLLETNGIHWRALEEIIEYCDWISMDLKLSSVSHEKKFLDEHEKFFKIALRKNVYLKMVVAAEIDLQEFDSYLHRVASIAPQVPVFLQPVAQTREAYDDPGILRLLDDLQRRGSAIMPHMRIGLQLHKVFNIH